MEFLPRDTFLPVEATAELSVKTEDSLALMDHQLYMALGGGVLPPPF